jgi:hypothetical protein
MTVEPTPANRKRSAAVAVIHVVDAGTERDGLDLAADDIPDACARDQRKPHPEI